MIQVHYSNRLEVLVDELAAQVLLPSDAPLVPELVAISHSGMRRWLLLELAKRHGVAANIHFPLPASAIWHLLRTVFPRLEERSPFEPSSLRWAVLDALDDVAKNPASEPVRHYLAGADPLMRYELASKFAQRLDQYLVYRPDWVRRWAQGRSGLPEGEYNRHEAWQAALLRLMRERLGATDWLSVLDRLLQAFAEDGRILEGLPQSIHLFAVTALSPAYVDVLVGFSAHLDVHLYAMNPCREYWGDIVPARPAMGGVEDEGAAYYARGNALLASLGRVGRELIDTLQDVGAVEHEVYQDADPRSILGLVQQDILDLRDRARDEDARLPTLVVPSDDRSVQVHVCHSPVREMEVLRDQLLALFDEQRDLAPSDIVVMTPRIHDYASAIQTVFGRGSDDLSIPYAIVDRRAAQASPVLATYMKLLTVVRGRFGADEVLGLLSNPALRRRFRIGEDALTVVTRWVREAGIHWGADAQARERAGAPPDDWHTWRFGLDRLVLGLSMVGAYDNLFAELHPYDGVTGGDAELLGSFTEFIELLMSYSHTFQDERTVPDWCDLLRQIAARFFDPRAGEEREMQALLGGLDEVAQVTHRAQFKGKVPLSVVDAELTATLSTISGRGGGFDVGSGVSSMFTGRVTFCEMVPMRSIPFAVVCLVGMNDGAYPRRDPRLGFDLMSEYPRRGDRTPRDYDRYLFLECLLAARKTLYLSYVGFDNRENARLPPSPVILELLDYLSAGFGLHGSGAHGVVVEHPLQPFSPRYFASQPRLFSYDLANFQASRALVYDPEVRPGFVDPPLAPRAAQPAQSVVAIEEFVASLLHPSRHFLQGRLGVRPSQVVEVVTDVEPFAVGGLERYLLRQTVLDGLVRETAGPTLQSILMGDGQLPVGRIGEAVFGYEFDVVARHVAEGKVLLHRAESLDVALEIGALTLVGQLDGWHPDEKTLVLQRLGTLRAKDQLEAWLRHLIASCLVGPVETRFIAAQQVLEIAPVDAPERYLEVLSSLYQEGLTRPLAFFPEAALSFVKALERDRHAALRGARSTWAGSGGDQRELGEANDPYNLIAFGGGEPLGAEFERNAEAIMGPMVRLAKPHKL